MEDFQKRVLEEKAELGKKLDALEKFLTGEVYRKLPEKERILLQRQVTAMCRYYDILSERSANYVTAVLTKVDPDDPNDNSDQA